MEHIVSLIEQVGENISIEVKEDPSLALGVVITNTQGMEGDRVFLTALKNLGLRCFNIEGPVVAAAKSDLELAKLLKAVMIQPKGSRKR